MSVLTEHSFKGQMGTDFTKERKIYLHEIKKIPQTFVLLQMSLWAEIVLFRDDYAMIEICDVDFLWQETQLLTAKNYTLS